MFGAPQVLKERTMVDENDPVRKAVTAGLQSVGINPAPDVWVDTSGGTCSVRLAETPASEGGYQARYRR